MTERTRRVRYCVQARDEAIRSPFLFHEADLRARVGQTSRNTQPIPDILDDLCDHLLVRGKPWRKLGRPEASVVGVQYVGSNHGATQAGFVVAGAATEPWVFAGTGLADGDVFGRYGIEIDARSPASPPGTQLLARIPQLLGNGGSAEMTYYETTSGAKVFAAGALNFAASLGEPQVAQLVQNVWDRLSKP